MFDKLRREMKKLESGVQVPIQIPLDDDGQLDRRCPSEECQTEFKVLFDDWKDKVLDEVVYTTYRVGQKIVIKDGVVNRLAHLVERLASHL